MRERKIDEQLLAISNFSDCIDDTESLRNLWVTPEPSTDLFRDIRRFEV